MNQQLLFALVTVLLVRFSAPVVAQAPQLSLPTINQAAEGAILSVPVTVQNFDSIVSIGMVIKWDPSVIRFLGVSDYTTAFPDFDSDDIGTTEAIDSGELRVVWWKFSFSGFHLDDGDTLFTIRYRVVGPLNSGTPIEFTELNPQLIFEIQQASGQTYSLQNMDLENGFVAVGYTVPVFESKNLNTPVVINPNPLRPGNELNVQFDNQTNDNYAVFSFYNSSGQLLFQEIKNSIWGEATYTFSLPQYISCSSNLWLLVEIGSERIMKKVVVLP